MKLSDISNTKAGIAATKKLSNQVSKVSVAAGKQPRTELGVVGISIRQAQSTGDTSRVNESTIANTQQLMLALAEQLGYSDKLPAGSDEITEQAYAQALIIACLFSPHDDGDIANALFNSISSLIHYSTSVASNLRASDTTLVSAESTTVGAIHTLAATLTNLKQLNSDAKKQMACVAQIIDFVHYFTDCFNDADPYRKSVSLAVAKKLGMKT